MMMMMMLLGKVQFEKEFEILNESRKNARNLQANVKCLYGTFIL